MLTALRTTRGGAHRLTEAQQGFYDPVNEKFTEPQHPGISYSFTEDGYFESAYFRAIANRTLSTGLYNWKNSMLICFLRTAQQPQCPKGIIQWQHGRYTLAANGRLTLTPFGVDGRQLFSDPCIHSSAILTRYSQSEEFEVRNTLILAPRPHARQLTPLFLTSATSPSPVIPTTISPV